jgi:tetratricopeptide (TPR) repeat protein
MKRSNLTLIFFLCLLLSLTPNLTAQNPASAAPFFSQIHGGGGLPIGESSGSFQYSANAHFTLLYAFKRIPFFFGTDVDYSLAQLSNDEFLSNIGGSVHAQIGYSVSPNLSVYGFGQGGIALNMVMRPEGPVVGANLKIAGGGGVSYFFSDFFGFGVRASYENYPGLYSGVSVSVGTEFRYGTRGGKKAAAGQQLRPEPLAQEISGDKFISIDNITINEVFPVFYKYYDDSALGTVTLTNISDDDIEQLSVKTYVNKFMDSPKISSVAESLKPGESVEVPLYALFNDEVINITEATKVAVNLMVDFKVGETDSSISRDETLRIHDRNAITWDDDKKAAAFVSPKDPSVLTVAKNIAGIVKRRGSSAVNQNLLMAMGMHSMLPTIGMTYVIDPQTPYAEFSKTTDIIDFIQYPRQTLQYRAGDCDDLAVLYCSLLEAVGVETAFVTIPGHIYMAFSTGLTEKEARRQFFKNDDLIYIDGAAWIPVEITLIDEGFLKAWAVGAKEWRENDPKKQAKLYPVHDAWALYEPVGISGAVDEGVSLTSTDEIIENFYSEMVRYIDQEIFPRIADIQEQIDRRGKSPKLLNKMGVSYAEFGIYDKSKGYFTEAVETENYVPALLNLGNLYYLEEDLKNAQLYYQRAYDEKPDHPKAVLSIARVNHELENYGIVKQQYAQLKELDPDLAIQFAYLDLRGNEAARASSAAGIQKTVLWDEE